uniref:hypothetical protein n=1 Tax=Salmonella sp. s54836 TaxID=3159673 RepID=UPI003980FCA1
VELKRGVELLGEIDEIFYSTSPYMVPTDDGTKSNIFITSSYDATTHFETTCVELEAVYEKNYWREI